MTPPQQSRADFLSDNVAPVAPAILDAIVAANTGLVLSYGEDALTHRLDDDFARVFETTLRVLPVSTGTAANALALSVLAGANSTILCRDEAHIRIRESGAATFFTGGARLHLLPGHHGKIEPDTLATALESHPDARPAVLSLTQATENGTLYALDELRALTALARQHGLTVHMDGARFANAVAALGCTPAELSWHAGVDALSFGATKNGAMSTDAVVVFEPTRLTDAQERWERAGQLSSKMRFAAAQLQRYLEDGLWLHLAEHANAMAARLAEGLRGIAGVSFVEPVETNQLFVVLPQALHDALTGAGYTLYTWLEGPTVRLVTSFATTAEDVDAFLAVAQRA